MVCIETEDDEDFGGTWKCECGHWNLDEDDECQNCYRFWE